MHLVFRTRPSCLLIALASVGAAKVAHAQSVSPPIAEYREKARASFNVSNQSVFPLTVVLQVKGFVVDEDGELRDVPLDTARVHHGTQSRRSASPIKEQHSTSTTIRPPRSEPRPVVRRGRCSRDRSPPGRGDCDCLHHVGLGGLPEDPDPFVGLGEDHVRPASRVNPVTRSSWPDPDAGPDPP